MNAKSTFVLDQLFAQTARGVPPDAADYVLGIPNHRETGRALGITGGFEGLLLNRADDVEFELRQYLAGSTFTRHHLNKAIRSFLTIDREEASAMTALLLAGVELTLLENEWYELMPRLKGVFDCIGRQFGIYPISLTVSVDASPINV